MRERQYPLYHEEMEQESCGVGAVADLNGKATHRTVDQALRIVERLAHRAGSDAEGTTGDGVGIMTQLPHALFADWAREEGIVLGAAGDYGVGMFFLPEDEVGVRNICRIFEQLATSEGIMVLGWRDVPCHPAQLGAGARRTMPRIRQCFLSRPEGIAAGQDFDRRLYVLRRAFEKQDTDTYICSLSCRTIVYKGMMLVSQLRSFYDDLQDVRFCSQMAMVHSRFSTNTFPSWSKAHPQRLLLHNGEINTIRGNVDRMLAREETMSSPFLQEDMDKIFPVVSTSGSDSAMLDNTVEFLMMNGIDLPLAMMITIPEPWKNDRYMPRKQRDLFHYYATMMEPWDGPASILFSDGELVGAILDRNGLRPSRYYLTDDGKLYLSSEVGVLSIPEEHVIRKDRMHPGKMLLVDTKRGRLLEDDEIKDYYASRQPYGEWLDQNLVQLSSLPIPNRKVPRHSQEMRDRLYRAFGYTYEQIKDVLEAHAADAVQSVSTDQEEGLPQIEIFVDRDKLYDMGLNIYGVGSEISAAINGTTASRYTKNGDDIDVVVQLSEADKNKISDLDQIFVMNSSGVRVPLSSIASYVEDTSPVTILRENQARMLHVSVEPVTGLSLDVVQSRVRQVLDDHIPKDENITISFSGDYEDMLETVVNFAAIVIMAAALVFVVMASQFESLIDPFIILMTIPFSFIGVIMIYLLVGQQLNVITVMGILVLVGTIVNNGIVLVDYTNLFIMPSIYFIVNKHRVNKSLRREARRKARERREEIASKRRIGSLAAVEVLHGN